MRAAILVALLLPAAPAQAFCMHHDVMYATTTIPQEFAESRWVVRAKVVSGKSFWAEHGGAEPWTSYRLKVVKSYKGRLGKQFNFFTFRNSGGFYMDAPSGAGPDIGRDYLLFLMAPPHPADLPKWARDSLWVNYACGQSKPWREVTRGEAALVERLAQRPH